MKYKNIVFDFGNVIGTFDPDYILGQFCDDKADFPILSKAIYQDWVELDAGTLEYEKGVELAIARVPARLKPTLEHFFKDWYKHLTPLLQTWDFVHELKSRGVPIYLLSNAPQYFADHADIYEIMQEFDGVLFSGPVKLAKPDPAIYQLFFKTFDLNPKECFFLDDRIDNINAAKACGMDGMVYTGDVDAVKKAVGF